MERSWKRGARSICTDGRGLGLAGRGQRDTDGGDESCTILTFALSWWSLCICRHCPRYIKLSLILPASAKVAPAVFAFRARSDPTSGQPFILECLDTRPYQLDLQRSEWHHATN